MPALLAPAARMQSGSCAIPSPPRNGVASPGANTDAIWERITQPSKIAIIYSHSAEANEYRAYIDYLTSLGYFAGEVEDVELEELQGVHGLRALRIGIDLRNPKIERRVAITELQAAAADPARIATNPARN